MRVQPLGKRKNPMDTKNRRMQWRTSRTSTEPSQHRAIQVANTTLGTQVFLLCFKGSKSIVRPPLCLRTGFYQKCSASIRKRTSSIISFQRRGVHCWKGTFWQNYLTPFFPSLIHVNTSVYKQSSVFTDKINCSTQCQAAAVKANTIFVCKTGRLKQD